MELNEKARLQALRRYKILHTDPERAFDDLTIPASHICEAVAFALLAHGLRYVLQAA